MLEREACRRAFVERFSVQLMAHDYKQLGKSNAVF